MVRHWIGVGLCGLLVGGAVWINTAGWVEADPWLNTVNGAVGFGAAIWLTVLLTDSSRDKRRRPDGYVGRFRRTDGSVVHVARMESGRLWAADDGHPARGVGYVEGRDLLRWEKLASEPDG